MKKITVDVDELDELISAALEELYVVRDKTQKAIEKFHHIKGSWIDKQEMKSKGL